MSNITNSKKWFKYAQNLLPGGVNSPVRAFKHVNAHPRVIKGGRGAYLYDADGNTYIDYVCSWGPLILGHAHPDVLEKVSAALTNGFTFGALTEIEVMLAEKVIELMPSMEMVRFVSSGTEATMSAIRLARGVTQRRKILKFIGCYHGHADSLLVAAGSGGLTFGVPSSAGVLKELSAHTLLAHYNDLEHVEKIFAEFGQDIAAVIVEPVAGNMNLVLPTAAFLPGLRRLCDAHGSLLIFDEVITGFRVGLHGASAHFNITPDLTILGKIIGGGFPAAAFGGKKAVMSSLSPLGPVYQAGTLSGNPIAMTAGLATLECLCAPNFYEALENKTKRLTQGLEKIAKQHEIPLHIVSIASMFGLFFTDQKQILHEDHVKRCHTQRFNEFFSGMLEAGIYLAPSPYEIGFVSQAHGDHEIDQTLQAFSSLLKLSS